MKSNKIILLVVVVIIVAIGWFAFGPKKAPTPEQNAQNAQKLEEEQTKAAIVSAILNQQKVLASKDVKQIRAYFLKIAATPQDKTTFTKMSDKDMLAQAAFSSSFGKDITAEDFKSDKVKWSITPDISVVSLTKGNKDVRFTVQKVDGEWY